MVNLWKECSVAIDLRAPRQQSSPDSPTRCVEDRVQQRFNLTDSIPGLSVQLIGELVVASQFSFFQD